MLAGLASLFLLLVWGPIGRRLHLERLGLIKAGAEHPDLPTLSDLKFDPASLRLAPGGAWVVGVASVEGRRSVVGLQVPVVPRAEAVEPALTWVRSGWSAGDPVRVLVLNGKTLVQRRDGSAAVLKEADGKLAGEVMRRGDARRAKLHLAGIGLRVGDQIGD